MCSLVGDELSFLKLGLVLVGFSGEGVEITVFEVNCEFHSVDWK